MYSSVNRVKEIIQNCRQKLKSDSNLFWVNFQSNQLADTSHVRDDFKEALKDMKEEFNKGWMDSSTTGMKYEKPN